MNAWKNHRLSFMLVAGSLLLLLAFQIFWLKNTYQNEKENLRKKADLIFEDAIRNVEDSLFQMLVLDPTTLSNPIGKTEIAVGKIFNEPLISLPSLLSGMQISEEDSLFDVKIDLRTNFSMDSGKNNFGSIALWMARDSIDQRNKHTDSIYFDIDNFDVVKSKLNDLMIRSDLPTSYELLTLKDKKLPKGDFYSNPHTDILSHKSYAIYFPNFSFFMVWKSLEKQWRLTELKNDFISNVTHELKTPITTVGVALEALSNFNALQNPQRTEEYLNISKHELQRLSILVDKVLKMSLFEKKEPELKLETFNMQNLVQGVLRSMKLQFEKFSANVSIDFEGSNFFIKGDKIHLTNVVYNLIDNALKYSKGNPEIKLLLKQKNNQLQLIVQDEGIGIAQDLKNKIFEKFFRVPQGNQHDVKGYGLGLSYVAGVIKQHHGNIEVDSQINQGTAFTISIPVNYE